MPPLGRMRAQGESVNQISIPQRLNSLLPSYFIQGICPMHRFRRGHPRVTPQPSHRTAAATGFLAPAGCQSDNHVAWSRTGISSVNRVCLIFQTNNRANTRYRLKYKKKNDLHGSHEISSANCFRRSPITDNNVVERLTNPSAATTVVMVWVVCFHQDSKGRALVFRYSIDGTNANSHNVTNVRFVAISR